MDLLLYIQDDFNVPKLLITMGRISVQPKVADASEYTPFGQIGWVL